MWKSFSERGCDVTARPTIRDVAIEAGVGISTVSKALNHGAGSPEVLARVNEAAARLGYRPSRQAAGLRRGSTGRIGVLIPDLANPVFVAYLRGVESVARSRGRSVQVADGQGTTAETEAALRQLTNEQVDGVVLAGPVPAALVKEVREAGIAVLPDATRDRAHLRAWSDAEVAATRDLVARLIGLGHRCFAWVVPASSSRQRRAFRPARYDAFVAAVEAAGGVVEVVLVPIGEPPVDVPEVLRGATAVICGSQAVAPLVLRWLREDSRRVGRDVSVAAYGDSPWTLAVDPPLAVVRHDTWAEGADAATALIDRLEGRPDAARATPTASFVDRPSIGKAR